MTVHLSMWAAMGLIWDGAVAWGERVTGWMGEDALVPHWLRALMANLYVFPSSTPTTSYPSSYVSVSTSNSPPLPSSQYKIPVVPPTVDAYPNSPTESHFRVILLREGEGMWVRPVMGVGMPQAVVGRGGVGLTTTGLTAQLFTIVVSLTFYGLHSELNPISLTALPLVCTKLP
jgi:hypothetical protein